MLIVFGTRSRCGGNLTANELHRLSVRTFVVQTVQTPDRQSCNSVLNSILYTKRVVLAVSSPLRIQEASVKVGHCK